VPINEGLEGVEIAMTRATNDCRAERYPALLKVYCSFERVEGIATLVNISYTGALLENTEMRPEIGAHVKLFMHLKPHRAVEPVAPSELTGAVARHSSDGFAIEFKNSHDPDVHRMVNNAAALVTGTH
jgi:hypothetical protein